MITCTSGSPSITMVHFEKQFTRSSGKKAMFSLSEKTKILRLLVDIVCELFDKCVAPVLIYGSEVYKGLRDVEIFHRNFLRMLLRTFKMTSSNGSIFRVTGLLCGEFTGHRWIPHKGQWRGALMFPLICAWINGWVNNGEAGGLRRHRAHYDITVIFKFTPNCMLNGETGSTDMRTKMHAQMINFWAKLKFGTTKKFSCTNVHVPVNTAR